MIRAKNLSETQIETLLLFQTAFLAAVTRVCALKLYRVQTKIV